MTHPSTGLHALPVLAATACLSWFPAATAAQTPGPDFPFPPVDTNFSGTRHHVPPSPLQTLTLMRSLVDTGTNHLGQTATVREDLDFIGYVPIDGRSDSGYVIVNHETDHVSDVHGDGGGMTVFTAHFANGTWAVADHPGGRYRTVDFTSVGGTWANCGGGITPWGTVLTGEEWMTDATENNAILHNNGNHIRDTSDVLVQVFNGDTVNRTIRRHQNMNWVVEVDPATARAVKKHHNMGRAAHELGYPMPDGRTVYVTDDFTPAVFYKFVSEEAGNYDRGQLYAYRQSDDGESGSWIPMPMDLDSMIAARDVALRRGATAFTRHEWVVHHGRYVYITETGKDDGGDGHRDAVRAGGRLARHLAPRLNADSTINDYHGRVLRLDTATGKMDVLIEGGAGSNGLHFSNPDCLTTVALGTKRYLVICEDINGTSQGRVSPAAGNADRTINELYWLDLSIADPQPDDLRRMLVGPAGAEITGARFTPDGRTMFVNIQHPSTSNASPYNRSYTLAVWGYEAPPAGLAFDPPAFGRSDRLQVAVNAASRLAYFDRTVDVDLHNAAGRRLERHKGVRMLDIQHLAPGGYYLRFGNGEAHRLLLE